MKKRFQHHQHHQTQQHFLILFLTTLLLHTKPTFSRLHNPISSPSPPPPLTLSKQIPSLQTTLQLAHLSSMVYSMKTLHATNCTPFESMFEWYQNHHPTFETDGATYRCHLYERDRLDTQVLVLSRTSNSTYSTYSPTRHHNSTKDEEEEEDKKGGVLNDYIAVVYAGTDDFRNALTDAHIVKSKYGPQNKDDGTYPLSPGEDIRVHAGFNSAVFGEGLMDRIIHVVDSVLEEDDDENDNGMYGIRNEEMSRRRRRRVYTTGHSLGGADAILSAVALAQHWNKTSTNNNNTSTEGGGGGGMVDDNGMVVRSVSFGCPKTGNLRWREYVNSLEGVGIWRVVNKIDLVPRMPNFTFRHAGHTIQLNRKNTKAYWLHEGDKVLGYRGVPFGWSASSYILSPISAYDHVMGHYLNYLDSKSLHDETNYYVNDFEHLGKDDVVTKNDFVQIEEEQEDDERKNEEEKWEQWIRNYKQYKGIVEGYWDETASEW